MSEGELHKCMRQNSMEPLISICPHDTVGECDCHIRPFLEIVNEAKKEFPIWDNSEPESRLTEDVLLDLVKQKDAWFKKWLGGRNECAKDK